VKNRHINTCQNADIEYFLEKGRDIDLRSTFTTRFAAGRDMDLCSSFTTRFAAGRDMDLCSTFTTCFAAGRDMDLCCTFTTHFKKKNSKSWYLWRFGQLNIVRSGENVGTQRDA
jgi:hypothetical protein